MTITKRLQSIPLAAKRYLNATSQIALTEDYVFTELEYVALRNTYKHLAANKLKEAEETAAQTELSARLFEAVTS